MSAFCHDVARTAGEQCQKLSVTESHDLCMNITKRVAINLTCQKSSVTHTEQHYSKARTWINILTLVSQDNLVLKFRCKIKVNFIPYSAFVCITLSNTPIKTYINL